MKDHNESANKVGNTPTMENLITEIKEIWSECDNKIAEVLQQQASDLCNVVSQEDWEKSVDRIKEYDVIRAKKPFVRRFMGAMKIDANSFYSEMKKLGPMTLKKVSKREIDAIFLNKAKIGQNLNYQTFFNGYPIDSYGLSDSMQLIRNGDGVCYAYLPSLGSMMMMSQQDIVEEIEKAKAHFSSMYIPNDFELYSWYILTENIAKKHKYEQEYYDEKIEQIKSIYRDKVEEKITLIIELYENLKEKYPLNDKLTDLLEKDVQQIPEYIAFGSCIVETQNGHIRIPQLRKFPLSNSMWFGKNDLQTLYALYVRLLCSLPIGKIQFTIFDPRGNGANVSDFNSMFSTKEVFPAKKVLISKQELKSELQNVLNYVRNIRQDIFNSECPNWVKYNEKMGKDNVQKMLPYKVFTFFDVPDEMDSETLGMIEKVIGHSRDCGFLVLFSYQAKTEKATEEKWNILNECICKSKSMSDELNGPDESLSSIKDSVDYSIEFVDETISDKTILVQLLENYLRKLEKKNIDVKFDFRETVNVDDLFGSNSCKGLEFTIGYDDKSAEAIKLRINDETPHYLVGGTTGSGKSNLLHNLIMSACARYSPQELQVYLMDFKEGVEFSTYAEPLLPHARLVAMEADTEYGVNVLEHLIKEKEDRYKKFKQAGCKDITAFRLEKTDEIMPRIITVIDEFQVLFGNKDKAKTIENLTMLAKQGRACGIHLIMSTQTLSGLEFGSLESQFPGRIVLKCNAEDSKRLLGGISSNNEAATELKIPYAIVNTQNGQVSGNVKISVPYAEPIVIKETLRTMKEKVQGQYVAKTVVFDGQNLPTHPEDQEFKTQKAELILGKEISFKAEKFAIKLQSKEANNVLGVVKDDFIRRNLIKSMMLSAVNSETLDEFVYVGTDEKILQWEENTKVALFESVVEFLEYIGEDMFNRKRLVFFDNCNLAKEVSFPTGYGAVPMGDAKKILDYIKECCENKSYCVAFYSRLNNMKNGKMPLEFFDYKIGCGLNDDDTRAVVGNMSLVKIERGGNRCFFAENGSIEAWFQPFVTEEEE